MDIPGMGIDVAGLSSIMAQNKTLANVGYALLDQQLELQESNASQLTKMMELSVNPNLGGNIDVSV